jgi:hypothetical protein
LIDRRLDISDRIDAIEIAIGLISVQLNDQRCPIDSNGPIDSFHVPFRYINDLFSHFMPYTNGPPHCVPCT